MAFPFPVYNIAYPVAERKRKVRVQMCWFLIEVKAMLRTTLEPAVKQALFLCLKTIQIKRGMEACE